MVSAVSLLPLVSTVLSAVLVVVAVVVPVRHTRVTAFFILLNVSAVAWSAGYFLRLNVSPRLDPALASPGSQAYFVLGALVLGAAATPTYWFLFGAEAAGLRRWTRGWRLVAAHVPLAFTLAAALTNTWHRLFVVSQADTVIYGPLARIHHVSGSALGTVGFLLFLSVLWRRPEGRQADVLALGITAAIPYAGSVLWMTRDVTHLASETVAQALAAPALQPIGNLVLVILVFRTGLADLIPVGLLRTIMENTDAHLAYLDARLDFVAANSTFQARVGLTEGQLRGRHLSEVVRNADVLATAERARELRSSAEYRSWPDALGCDDQAGTSYWNWSLRPVMNKGRLRGFVFSVADVTEEVLHGRYAAALSSLTRRLHSTFDAERVLPPIIASAAKLLKADASALVLGTERRWSWVPRCEARQPAFEPFEPADWPHIRMAVELRRPVVVPDARRDPLFAEGGMAAQGMRRMLAVPLLVNGSLAGVIAFAGAAPGDYSPAQLAFVHELARAAAIAFQNSRLYHSERRIAETLQDAMLQPPQRIEGLDIAHGYRTASELARVGGDFYDVFETDGQVALLIGDVSGKGVEAAALTSMVKNVVRSETMEGASPSRILATANDSLRRRLEIGSFVTVFLGMLELESGSLRYASAGHPGPFVLRGTGGVERLQRSAGLLGVFEGMEYPGRETALERGDLLLMYTDGLVETRRSGGPVEEDLEPLLVTLSAQEPREVVDAVMRHAIDACGGELKDDVAVLAIRLGPAASGQQ
ncbi:MAG: SpoIIE family protein phosphatase [Coriobacteriia bacterium]|nr:SpoIIE family protein phosphatase [Coriobacteriia bacterium]